MVTALSGHPLNPFHFFIVTTFHVLLLDLRQSEEPVSLFAFVAVRVNDATVVESSQNVSWCAVTGGEP